jgi:hypothetical protein
MFAQANACEFHSVLVRFKSRLGTLMIITEIVLGFTQPE